MQFCKAKDSNTLIKSALKSRAGASVHISVGDITRCLSHHPLRDAPFTRLPWPLSSLQPHNVQYTATKGDETIEKKTFPWGEVDKAIDFFLNGVDGNESVHIWKK